MGRTDFIAFAQRKFGYRKDMTEEAHKVLVDALLQDGIVEDSVPQAAIDEARNVTHVTKPVSHADVVD